MEGLHTSLREGGAERIGTYSCYAQDVLWEHVVLRWARGENVEIAQRGKIDRSATATMDSVRGFLQFHASFPTKMNFAPKGNHGTYRNACWTYRNVIEWAILVLGAWGALFSASAILGFRRRVAENMPGLTTFEDIWTNVLRKGEQTGSVSKSRPMSVLMEGLHRKYRKI